MTPLDKTDPFADLRQLLMPVVEETIGGKTLRIRPFDFERLPAVADLLAAAKQFIVVAQDGVVDFDFIGLFARQHSTAMQLLHELSGESIDWLGKLSSDEALFLFAVYVRVNSDFFIQRLAPLLMSVWSSLAGSVSEFSSPAPGSASSTASAGPMSSVN